MNERAWTEKEVGGTLGLYAVLVSSLGPLILLAAPLVPMSLDQNLTLISVLYWVVLLGCFVATALFASAVIRTKVWHFLAALVLGFANFAILMILLN